MFKELAIKRYEFVGHVRRISETLTCSRNCHSHMTVLPTTLGAHRMSRTVDVGNIWYADNDVEAVACDITWCTARVSELQRRNRWCDTFTDGAQNFFLHHMLTNFRYQVLYLKNLSIFTSIQAKVQNFNTPTPAPYFTFFLYIKSKCRFSCLERVL